MLVDAHGCVETQKDLVHVHPVVGNGGHMSRRGGRRVGTVDVAVTDNAAQAQIVHLLFEGRDPNAEIVQLVGELGGQLVHEGFVRAGGMFCHGAGHHLRHLVAGNLLAASITAVAVAFDHAVGGKLRHGVIGPMVGGHVLERIGRGKSGMGRTNNQRCRQRS